MTTEDIDWNKAKVIEPTEAQVDIERLECINDKLIGALEDVLTEFNVFVGILDLSDKSAFDTEMISIDLIRNTLEQALAQEKGEHS